MLVLPPPFPYGGMENPRMTFDPTVLPAIARWSMWWCMSWRIPGPAIW
jgi:hypothetical protein